MGITPMMARTFLFSKCIAAPIVRWCHQVERKLWVCVPLELTLALIKPHICKNPYNLEEIRRIIFNDGFLFVRSCQKILTSDEAERFYAEHKGKFFYNRLVTLMTSGECCAHVLARHDAIARWRQLMGPTKVNRARIEQPDTIRGRFGVTDTRNATHGSDSVTSANQEIRFFFPDFSVQKWYDKEELVFRRFAGMKNGAIIEENYDCDKSMVNFDSQAWLHRMKDDLIQDEYLHCDTKNE